jgi:hypothetical protein
VRCLWATALVAMAVGLWAAPAQAGGSTWKFDAEWYEPGQRAFAWASVAWEHSPMLGTPEDGPYSAYLAPAEPATPWPPIPGNAVRVADVAIDLAPYDAGAVRYGPHHATIEFTVPDLPAGRYTVMHCNSSCTTTLGDITFGILAIGPVAALPPAPTPPPPPPDTAPPPPPAPETLPPETSPPSTQPSTSTTITADGPSAGRSDFQPLLLGGVTLGLVGGSAAAWHRRPRRPGPGRRS